MNPTTPEVPGPWPDGLYSIKRHGVTITNCDAEPIRTPGCIQNHGALLALRIVDLVILQASENCATWLGLSPEKLLGNSIAVLVSPEREAQLRAVLEHEPIENNPLYVFTLPAQHDVGCLDVVIHTAGGIAIVEFEATGRGQSFAEPDYYGLLKKNVARLNAANNLFEFCQQVTELYQALTGLDRVMIYRFHADEHGEVIAESRRNDLPPWLGLHYPAEDVPKPAREIFMKIWIRPLPDAKAAPVELVPLANPDTGQALDMTYCSLRGASIMYTEYLQNMGVASSLTMPIHRNGRLWGLIACHHYTATSFPYQMRAVCEFMAQVVSLQIKEVEEREQLGYRLKLEAAHGQLVKTAAQEGNLICLTESQPNLLGGIEAGGVAVYVDERWWCIGKTPAPAQLDSLAEWLKEQTEQELPARIVYATDNLAGIYQSGLELVETASGLLAVSLSSPGNLILWFRPEIVQTVNWAGNPHEKPTVPGSNGPRLTPRTSFELFTESVLGRSLPWKEVEIEAAIQLRLNILELVIKRAEQLAKLNADLLRSNEELDTFAYVASHDLKEPLRGISKYAHQLQESANILDEENRQRLQSLMRLTLRMDSLLESLLHFSRLGRAALELESVDFNEVVAEALEMTAARRAESQADVVILRQLPNIACDRVRVREIFVNLISNALKYNDKPIHRLEVGYWKHGESDAPSDISKASPPPFVFFVRDNGIGIDPRHHEQVFKIFKRLHTRDAYGGGSGAGLTIVRLLVERHGGKVWLTSKPGVGSTFYFTLGDKPSPV